MKERTVVRHFCIGQGHLLFHHATHNPNNNKALENVAMFASGLKHNYKPDKRKKTKTSRKSNVSQKVVKVFTDPSI